MKSITILSLRRYKNNWKRSIKATIILSILYFTFDENSLRKMLHWNLWKWWRCRANTSVSNGFKLKPKSWNSALFTTTKTLKFISIIIFWDLIDLRTKPQTIFFLDFLSQKFKSLNNSKNRKSSIWEHYRTWKCWRVNNNKKFQKSNKFR